MASYADLNARPARDFLDAPSFGTDFDVDEDRSEQRYQDELKRCEGYTAFHIGINGTWSAKCKDGGHVSSYEGIGYHAYTADLLQAVLDSDCAFIVHRLEDDEIVDYDMRRLQREHAEAVESTKHFNRLVRAAREFEDSLTG